MKTSLWCAAVLCSYSGLGSYSGLALAADSGSDWLLPNLPMRLSIEVFNPSAQAVKGLATVSVQEARLKAPEFPGRLALALLLSPDSTQRPANFIPLQADDLDGDG